MADVIHIIDDDASFRRAIGRLLRSSGYEVVEHDSPLKFLARRPDPNEISCLLMDLRMPGMSGLELQERLGGEPASPPIVFITGHGDIPTSVNAIKAGAEDFLTKPVSAETLLPAVARAIARHQSQLEAGERIEPLRVRYARLTLREREVFGLVGRGKMNKEIAHELGTTERTIKAHRQRVMTKLEARSFAELLSIAHRLGTGAK